MFTEEPIGERGEFQVSSPDSDDRLAERDDSVGAVDRVRDLGASHFHVQVDDGVKKVATLGRYSSPSRTLFCP